MTESQHEQLPKIVRDKLEDAYCRICSGPLTRWLALERCFSQEQRAVVEADWHNFDECRQQQSDEKPAWKNIVRWYMELHGVSQYRSIIDVAFKLDFLTVEERKWLLRETNEDDGDDSEDPAQACKPHWDRERRELTYRGEVIRRISGLERAKNVVAILDCFELDSWPPRIDDPLPYQADPVRLAAAVKSLNTGLTAIRFHKDGTGKGVAWREE